METHPYNQNILANFQVRIDGELVTPERPSAYVRASQSLLQALHSTKEQMKLETALMAYDCLHRTHYRKIRKTLLAAKRNAEFEARIGLVKK